MEGWSLRSVELYPGQNTLWQMNQEMARQYGLRPQLTANIADYPSRGWPYFGGVAPAPVCQKVHALLVSVFTSPECGR